MLEIFATNLIWHESLHFLIASTLAFFIFRKFKSWKLVLVIFALSFLVDSDHLTEGFLLNGFNLKSIFSFQGEFFRDSGRMTIFFHSWELLPLILLIGRKVNQWPLALTVVFALAGHYLVDQIIYTSVYSMPLLEYSLTWRAWHRFNWHEICGVC